MKHLNKLVLAVAIVVSIAALGTASAQDDPYGAGTQPAPTVSTTTVSGTLVSSSDSSLVVKSDDGVESSFTVDSSTIRPASLAPGDRVNVAYHMLDGGGYHASRVTTLSGSGSMAASGVEGTAPVAPGADPGSPSSTGEAHHQATGSELPQTASPLPLFAVMGVVAIGAALGVRAIFKRLLPSV